MELLALKHENQYIRIKENKFLLVGLDKASVFPKEELTKVKEVQKIALNQGISSTNIVILEITEKELG